MAVSAVGVSLGDGALAMGDEFTTASNAPLAIGIAELLSNDILGVTIVGATPPSKCLPSAGGKSSTYTPIGQPPRYGVTTESFLCTVQDGAGHLGTATVTTMITRALPRPLPENPQNTVTENHGVAGSIPALGTITSLKSMT